MFRLPYTLRIKYFSPLLVEDMEAYLQEMSAKGWAVIYANRRMLLFHREVPCVRWYGVDYMPAVQTESEEYEYVKKWETEGWEHVCTNKKQNMYLFRIDHLNGRLPPKQMAGRKEMIEKERVDNKRALVILFLLSILNILSLYYMDWARYLESPFSRVARFGLQILALPLFYMIARQYSFFKEKTKQITEGDSWALVLEGREKKRQGRYMKYFSFFCVLVVLLPIFSSFAVLREESSIGKSGLEDTLTLDNATNSESCGYAWEHRYYPTALTLAGQIVEQGWSGLSLFQNSETFSRELRSVTILSNSCFLQNRIYAQFCRSNRLACQARGEPLTSALCDRLGVRKGEVVVNTEKRYVYLALVYEAGVYRLQLRGFDSFDEKIIKALEEMPVPWKI